MPRNIASKKIIADKIGMKKEGYQREQVKRFGKYCDLEEYAILRKDWRERTGKGT